MAIQLKMSAPNDPLTNLFNSLEQKKRARKIKMKQKKGNLKKKDARENQYHGVNNKGPE